MKRARRAQSGKGPKAGKTATVRDKDGDISDGDDGASRETAERLFREYTDGGRGVLPTKSSDLWALAEKLPVQCLSFLSPADQARVQQALPGLLTAAAPPSGVTLRHFLSTFDGLRRKLLVKAKADALLASAQEAVCSGSAIDAAALFVECLKLAPRNAEAHLGYALLRWTADGGEELPPDDEVVETHLRSAVQFAATAEAQREASGKLALWLSQKQRPGDGSGSDEGDDEAERVEREELRALLAADGFRYRLSDGVLRYSPPSEGRCQPSQPADEEEARLMAVLDGALPLTTLSCVQAAFSPDSPFWAQHQYSSCPPSPYFSYCHSLSTDADNGMDQLIRLVQRVVTPHFPEVAHAKCAEWWAHCRPHPHGHQLHFDSDNEGMDGVRNPIVSTVLYLSEGVGGPTLMTNQHLEDTKLAARGWLAFPKLNRLVVFDGSYLHGVIPGRFQALEEGGGGGRRVTLMIAFWRHHLRHHPRDDGRPGACASPPAAPDADTWWGSLPQLPGTAGKSGSRGDGGRVSSPRRVGAQFTGAVWEEVCPERAAREGWRISQLSKLPSYELCFQGF